MKPPNTIDPDFALKCEGEWVTAMSASPDGKNLVTGSDKGVIKLWQLGKDVVSREVKRFSSPVTALLYCPKNDDVIVGTWDGDLIKLDLKSGKVVANYEEHRETITALDFSPDGKYLASGSADDRLIVWGLATGEDLLTMHQGNEYDVTTLAFSPDGKMIATGDGENQLKLWDADTGEALKSLKGHEEPVSQVVFDSKGTLISGSWDKTLRVWDEKKGQVLKGHRSEITSLEVLGRDLYSASEDGIVMIWNLDHGRLTKVLKGAKTSIRCLDVTRKGKLVLAGTQDKVFGWLLK
jgi:WD40 repeat protein